MRSILDTAKGKNISLCVIILVRKSTVSPAAFAPSPSRSCFVPMFLVLILASHPTASLLRFPSSGPHHTVISCSIGSRCSWHVLGWCRPQDRKATPCFPSDKRADRSQLVRIEKYKRSLTFTSALVNQRINTSALAFIDGGDIWSSL